MTENQILMQNAKASLSGKWGVAALVTLIYMVIVGGVSCIPWLGSIAILVIGGPFALGLILFAKAVKYDPEGAKVERLFDGFKRFEKAFLAALLTGIFTFLWMLLLIVPGIIAAYSYSMTMYIVAEDDNISAYDALKKSKQMMQGYKWKLFCLHLRFIGWGLLCILTLGIGFLWLSPYMQVATLNFYEDIKGNSQEEIIIEEVIITE